MNYLELFYDDRRTTWDKKMSRCPWRTGLGECIALLAYDRGGVFHEECKEENCGPYYVQEVTNE